MEKIVGIDEAGRGPLAGPVVAAAVLIKKGFNFSALGVRDSKKLTPQKREEIFKAISDIPEIDWAVSLASEKTIDRINILQATKLAMERAVKKLEKRYKGLDFLLIDGNFEIKSDIPQKAVIKGDEKIFSCACAGIIAKVARDKIMLNYHKKYPDYGFKNHKGYPTELHRDMIKKYGLCKIHRKTFTC